MPKHERVKRWSDPSAGHRITMRYAKGRTKWYCVCGAQGVPCAHVDAVTAANDHITGVRRGV